MNKLLIFSATWCKPCQYMKPIIDTLDNPNIEKYDMDTDRDIVQKYQVPGVPCFILVDENGKELNLILGTTTKETLEELLAR